MSRNLEWVLHLRNFFLSITHKASRDIPNIRKFLLAISALFVSLLSGPIDEFVARFFGDLLDVFIALVDITL